MTQAKHMIFAALAVGGSLFLADRVDAQAVGVLGLYASEQPAANVALDGTDCSLRQTGVIAGQLGTIGLKQPNRFVFLSCPKGLLARSDQRQVLTTLLGPESAVAVLEGELTDFTSLSDETRAGRQTILKISHYNNEDIDGRERDLAHIGKLVEKRADQYVTEAIVGVTKAIGLQTPDEVVLLSYADPQQGERFRKNNPDIMAMIGAFNKRHLLGTVYYIATEAP